MPSVKVEELTPESFRPFGTYANLLDPQSEFLGKKPVAFYRDMIPLAISNPCSLPSVSICLVEKRPLVVNISEYHSYTAEGNVSLDSDILFHVGPATPNGVFPKDAIRVFRIPAGVFVNIYPGVWHHAPFADRVAHVLCLLPERTYANDCIVKTLSKSDQLNIKI
ncbi:MAG: hypothetical protein LBU79_04325 [Planctomycetota bacterium]|jgi:ureidoglycolate lyase|nr:hypothetical protein [Planctomycetota bacterium]